MQRLLAALRARGASYEPRTRHRNADGTPKYLNRLILETSPYLLQHAHNPVNWCAWGDDAFARAAKEGRPVLLSIGYSTCHWCHVMERESFEDEEIARFINRALRGHQGRSRGAAGRGRRVHGRGPAADRLRGLADDPGAHRGAPPVLRGHLFPGRATGSAARARDSSRILKDSQSWAASTPRRSRSQRGRAERKSPRRAAPRRRCRRAPFRDPRRSQTPSRAFAASFDTTLGRLRARPEVPATRDARPPPAPSPPDGGRPVARHGQKDLEQMAAGGIYDQLGGDSTAIPRTRAGWCPTSRRCCTTTPSSSSPIWKRISAHQGAGVRARRQARPSNTCVER
jgi:hypothetical protein